MRVLNERLAGRDVDLTDGIKVLDERGWSQVLPDPDEPLVHLYAEGETPEVSAELEHELRELVEEIMQGDAAAAANLGRSLKLRLTPRRACCFTDQTSTERRTGKALWNRCPISPRSPTTTSRR